MSNANSLRVVRATNRPTQKLWERTRDRNRCGVNVVAIDSDSDAGDLLVIHRSDLRILARSYRRLDEALGPA